MYIKAESIEKAKEMMGDIADKFHYWRSLFKRGYIIAELKKEVV